MLKNKMDTIFWGSEESLSKCLLLFLLNVHLELQIIYSLLLAAFPSGTALDQERRFVIYSTPTSQSVLLQHCLKSELQQGDNFLHIGLRL